MDLKSHVRAIPDYPKPGIIFRDVTSLIAHPEAFVESIAQLSALVEGEAPDIIAGIEARGFVFGAALAARLGVGFVPVRKAGKLPGDTIGQNYALEYGTDTLEMHSDAVEKGARVVLIDDLLATGGTALAAINLLRRLEANVLCVAFVIDLPELGGRKAIEAGGTKVQTLIEFEGH